MRLFIGRSSLQPLVVFDLTQSFLHIEGMSSLTNAADFYSSIAKWLIDHKPLIQPGTSLRLGLYYLNSSSQKALYELLQTIQQQALPLSITIIQRANGDNEDVVAFLEQICRLLGLPYTIEEK